LSYSTNLALLTKMGLDTFPHRFGRLMLALHAGAGDPPATVRGLAEHLGIPKASVTRGADRLVLTDLATRVPDPKDKRSVVIALTAKGSKLAKQLAA